MAELALIAPGRVDLLDEVVAAVRRGRELGHPDWPPAQTTLSLLGRALQVMLGTVALVGASGERVEQVTVPACNGGPAVCFLRLHRDGTHVGDYRTADLPPGRWTSPRSWRTPNPHRLRPGNRWTSSRPTACPRLRRGEDGGPRR